MTESALDRVDAGGFRIAVIGSGPSGFYVTEALLRSGMPLGVDLFERLPVPYGLVQFGVAPDHPKLKLVTAAFDRIATTPGFRFIGGVGVGRDVTIDELRESYDAVVLATGADVSRSLDVPGEDLPGSHHAGDFVAWYNGHPDYRDCHFDLGCDAATVIGHGNVALDVARILPRRRMNFARPTSPGTRLMFLRKAAFAKFTSLDVATRLRPGSPRRNCRIFSSSTNATRRFSAAM